MKRIKGETLFNILLGLSIVFWGILGFLSHIKELTLLRLFISVLNLTIGVLFIIRRPAKKWGNTNAILLSLPSLICSGLMFKLAMPLIMWKTLPQILFFVGGAFACLSFIFLGRNFAVFPSIRRIVFRGTYRIVRHPAYLGEFFIIISLLISANSFYSYITFIIFIPSLIFRIVKEEQLLSSNDSYKTYIKKVKWKLIPFIW